MSNPLHERLRQERERRGLSLAAIARERGVREYNLVLIEQDAFEQLPTGLYGRNAVRAYASAVGLCADEALAAVADRLRAPEDPIDGLARVRGIVRTLPRRSIEVAASVAHPATGGLRWRPQVAAILDLAILLAIDLALVQLTALVAGVRGVEILRGALPSMFLLFALIAGAYYVLLGGIRQATIGARILEAPRFEHMLEGADAHTVLQRALQYAIAEGSSLAHWTDFSRQSFVDSRESQSWVSVDSH